MTTQRLSPVLYRSEYGRYAHYCPGCDTCHTYAVEQPFRNGAKWVFDGNVLQPTFTPSMHIRYAGDDAPQICHYFVRAGQIEYCSDSTHKLAGQTVPLPPVPPDYFQHEGTA